METVSNQNSPFHNVWSVSVKRNHFFFQFAEYYFVLSCYLIWRVSLEIWSFIFILGIYLNGNPLFSCQDASTIAPANMLEIIIFTISQIRRVSLLTNKGRENKNWVCNYLFSLFNITEFILHFVNKLLARYGPEILNYGNLLQLWYDVEGT